MIKMKFNYWAVARAVRADARQSRSGGEVEASLKVYTDMYSELRGTIKENLQVYNINKCPLPTRHRRDKHTNGYQRPTVS